MFNRRSIRFTTVVFVAAKDEQPSTVLSEIPADRTVVTEHICSRERFVADPMHRLLVHASDEEAAILSRVESECGHLDSVAKLSRGEEIGKKEVLAEGPIPILVGDDIDPYHIDQPSRFVQKTTKDTALYQAPKIVIVKTGDRCIAALDTVGFVTMQSVYNLHISCPDLTHEALLGLLNSRFVRCYIYKTFTAYKHLFPQLNQTTVQSIPVPVDMLQKQAPLVQLVRHMLSLHEKLAAANTTHDKIVLQRQIEVADRQIDLLICGMYGLTSEEMKVLEQGVP